MTRRTRWKVCGLCRPADVAAAVEAGVDAVGLVFHPPSPRHLELERARELARAIPPFVLRVGVFVDAAPETLRRYREELELDLLQLHGDESPALARALGGRLLKAFRVANANDLAPMRAWPSELALPLIDARVEGIPGGSGRRVPVAALRGLSRPYVLAGGLDPDNLGSALRELRPYAIDVSSGVEREPGIKDPQLLTRFAEALRAADAS